MKVHWLQHLPEEGLGSIEAWLHAHGHEPVCHRMDQRSALPEARDVAALIVMGGPMSVHDVQAHPWLDAERHLIRRMLQYGRPLLGICLGAQQIALALRVAPLLLLDPAAVHLDAAPILFGPLALLVGLDARALLQKALPRIGGLSPGRNRNGRDQQGGKQQQGQKPGGNSASRHGGGPPVS